MQLQIMAAVASVSLQSQQRFSTLNFGAGRCQWFRVSTVYWITGRKCRHREENSSDMKMCCACPSCSLSQLGTSRRSKAATEFAVRACPCHKGGRGGRGAVAWILGKVIQIRLCDGGECRDKPVETFFRQTLPRHVHSHRPQSRGEGLRRISGRKPSLMLAAPSSDAVCSEVDDDIAGVHFNVLDLRQVARKVRRHRQRQPALVRSLRAATPPTKSQISRIYFAHSAAKIYPDFTRILQISWNTGPQRPFEEAISLIDFTHGPIWSCLQ